MYLTYYSTDSLAIQPRIYKSHLTKCVFRFNSAFAKEDTMTDNLYQPTITRHHRSIVYHAGRKQYHLGLSHPDVYLTRREAECALLILYARSNKKAAVELGLSHRTIEYYLKNIRAKLGCYNRAHLIRVLKSIHFEEIIDFTQNDILNRVAIEGAQPTQKESHLSVRDKVLW